MVRVRLLALIVFLSSFSFGQTLIYTRTVKGNLFLPPGQGAQNSKMRFQLKYCSGQTGRVPVNPGNPPGPSGLVVSFEPYDVNVQSNGSWQTQVYGDDQIICGTDMSGPSRWLIQPIANGVAGAGVEYQIQSCGSASPCTPFSPDTALQCGTVNPSTNQIVTIDCIVESGYNPQPPTQNAGTVVTVNATAAVPNAINFGNVLLAPSNGALINFLLSGNQAGAYLPGNGNAATCLSGTGTWVLCGSGSGGGVSGATAGGGLVLTGSTLGLIRTCSQNQYLSWSGASWVCTTLSGGGGGLPTIAQYTLYASNGSGGAQDSGLLGGSGFMRGQVFLATGDVTSAPAPFPLAPNASVEYFPQGASFGGINVGAAHGLAAYFSHSGQSAAGPGYGNGGIMLGGGNSSGTNYQVYLDCESAPLGCDFKVPITVNGAGVGGGGGGGLPIIPAPTLFASNGSGGAVDSQVLGQSGFLRAYVVEATGTGNPSPWGIPNGSIEYFPSGGYGAGGVNGLALHVSHSVVSGFGGLALAGGNNQGTDQLYLDCEGPPVVPALGCDFKVPVTYQGNPIGGGGGGGSGTVSTGTPNFFAIYTGTTTVSSNPHLDDGQTHAQTITSTETIAAPGINVTGSGGISMTGTGGTLPTPVANQGGIGIGPGNVPEFYSNGGAWTAIGTGGSGGGATLPTTAAWDLFASTGSGAAQASGVFGESGFLRANVLEATGAGGSSPFSLPNGSIEYFPTGGYGVGGANGVAIHFSHSNVSGAAGNGGIALGGGNSSGANYQIYLDCEQATGCDFKVPLTVNGGAVGGGAPPNPWMSTGGTLTPVTGQGGFGIMTGGVPVISVNGGTFRTLPSILVNSSNLGNAPNPSSINFNGAVPSGTTPPTCSPAAPTNGRCITFQGAAAGNATVSAALVGDGTSNCLSGLGTYVPCGGTGGSGTVGTGSLNQVAVYTGTNAVAGSSALTVDGTNINTSLPIKVGTTGIISSGATVPSTVAGAGQIFFDSSGSIRYSRSGNGFVYLTQPAINNTQMTGSTYNNFNDTTPAQPANGLNVKWQVSGGNASAYFPLSGVATECLMGTGWATCPSGGGGGTSVTVNGTAAVPNSLNFNSAAPLAPTGQQLITFGLNGNNVSAYFTGDGNASHCLLGTGLFGTCPSGGGGGSGTVSSGTVGQAAFYTGATTVGANTNLDDGVTNAGVLTAKEAMMFPSGTAPPTFASGPGGFATNGTGVPVINGVSSTGVYSWQAIPYITVNNVARTVNGINFAFAAPVPPANGINITWNMNTGSQANISAALVGNGNAAQCLSGTATWVPCSGGSGTPALTTGGGLELSGTSTLGLLTTCTSGQHLYYNGTAWACTSNSPTATALAAAPTTCTAGQAATGILASGNATGCFTPPAGTVTGATPNMGLLLSGANLGLTNTCTNGQVLQYNGTQWVCQTITTGGGSGTVNSGTAGQFAWYSAAGTAVSGSSVLSDSGTVINSTEPHAFSTITPQLQFPSFPSAAPTPVSGTAQLSVYGAGGTAGGGLWYSTGSTTGSANTFTRVAMTPTVNSTLMATPAFTLVGTAPNTCATTGFPANARCVVFFTAGPNTGQISAALVGDGNASNCFLGDGTFAPCPGGASAGVSSINGSSGAFTFTGTGVTCGSPATTCTFNAGTGSGTVSSATAGQFGVYTAGTTVGGSSNLSQSGTTITLNAASGIYSAGGAPSQVTSNGGIGFLTNGIPAASINGAAFRAIQGPTSVNGTQFSSTVAYTSFMGSTASPCGGNTIPTNGKCINFIQGGPNTGQVAAALVGDGTSNCLSGLGTYVPCGTGGGSGTVGTGTVGQFAIYDGTNSVSGSAALTSGASTVTGATTNSIFATQPITLGTAGQQGIISTGATTALTTANATPGQIGFIGAGVPGIQFTGSGGALRPMNVVQINGTYPTSNLVNFNGTNANPPVCTPTAPTNGRCITFQVSGGSYSAAIVGDGNASNCLNGQGSYVPCSGAAASSPVTCQPSADLLAFTSTATNICVLNLPAQAAAKQWIVNCNLIWNRQSTGQTGTTQMTSNLVLSVAPTAASYFTTETWASSPPPGFGNVNVLTSPLTTLFNNTASAQGDTTIWSWVYHGTLMAPAAGMTATFTAASSNGTGLIRLGSFCTAVPTS